MLGESRMPRAVWALKSLVEQMTTEAMENIHRVESCIAALRWEGGASFWGSGRGSGRGSGVAYCHQEAEVRKMTGIYNKGYITRTHFARRHSANGKRDLGHPDIFRRVGLANVGVLTFLIPTFVSGTRTPVRAVQKY
eukprot:1135522-Prorocentrum_minimum.AAC.3